MPRVKDDIVRGLLAGWDEGGTLSDLAADLLDARAEVERLRARVEELEEALRVFYQNELNMRSVSLNVLKRTALLLDGAK